MKLLKVALLGESNLTLKLLDICYEHGHRITNIISTHPDVCNYALEYHIPLGLDNIQAADCIVITDDLGDLLQNFDKLPLCLICFRYIADNLDREHRVDWVVNIANQSTLYSRTQVSGGQLSNADAIWDCDRVAVISFMKLIGCLARGMSITKSEVLLATEVGMPPRLQNQSIRHRSNETECSYIYEQNLVAQFSKVVASHPENIALIFENKSLTYSEFNNLSDRLAERIVQMCKSKNVTFENSMLLGIMLPKSIELYVAILAVLKTGAAYIPLDPGYPSERLRWIAEDAGISIIITDKSLTKDSDIASNVTNLNVDLAALSVMAPICECLPKNIDSDALAVIIYTSGSTGRPKGVMIEHSNLLNFVAWYREYFAFDQYSTALQFSTVSFDASLLDMFPTWLAGGQLVVPSEQVRRSFDDLAKLIRDHDVTHAFLPPAWLANMPEENLPTLTHLITGGDFCSPDTIHRWSQNRFFHNIYGPTECTILATTGCFNENNNSRNIGFPIANVCCYVLDPNNQPARTGQEGELFIAGVGVGRGYLNKKDINSERYLPDPFSDIPRLMYKTGDMVRWTSTGALEFIGRIDTQIKVRGFRVELGEIEANILNTCIFRHAVAVCNEKKQIVVYVASLIVPEEPGSAIKRLKQLLKNQLPDYMFPSDIVQLDTLPATENGKIDRRMLASLPVASERSVNIEFPRNDIEVQLTEIWSKVLEIEENQIGIHDSFFELGGHSILVARMLLEVKRNFSCNTVLARFMENPTVASLSALLNEKVLAKGDCIPTRVYSDALLPDEINPCDEVNPYIRRPRNILLTGANGFLGCFMLAHLISITSANIFCLVRATSNQEARKRLEEALRAFGLEYLLGKPRIKVIAGNLESPYLGLNEDNYYSLCNSIDSIYHNAANVNHIYDYAYLYAVNVGSTLALLRFSTTGINKGFHYISTLSAASNVNLSGELVEAEPTNLPPAFINNGYNLTKWVSERLVWQALNRGLQTAIYRPGNITGDSRYGICQPMRNRILLLIKGCLQLGIFPRWNMTFDLCPVDFIAKAIICLSLTKTSLPIYHLHNPQSLTWVDYISSLKFLGYQFNFVEPAVWRSKLLQIDESNALFDIIYFYLDEENEDISDMSLIQGHRTSEILSGLGINYPETKSKLLLQHFRYLVESGFFPPPNT